MLLDISTDNNYDLNRKKLYFCIEIRLFMLLCN